MKRKITELEEKLQTLGFRLESKTYSGKHSQFSENYIYRGNVGVYLHNGEYMCVPAKVYLDKSRNHIVDLRIENFLDSWCGQLGIDTIKECFDLVMKEIY